MVCKLYSIATGCILVLALSADGLMDKLGLAKCAAVFAILLGISLICIHGAERHTQAKAQKREVQIFLPSIAKTKESGDFL